MIFVNKKEASLEELKILTDIEERVIELIDVDDYSELIDNYEEIRSDAISAAPNHRKGTRCSEETLQKMSKAKKGISTNRGYIWVNDGVKETMVHSEKLNRYLEEGFVRGRIYRHTEETRSRIGSSLQGQTRGDDFCKKMREIALKQPKPTTEQKDKHSKFMKEYYKHHENPFTGKHHSEESRRKMSESLKHKVTVNNGVKTLRVMDYNLDKYLSAGYVLGKRD